MTCRGDEAAKLEEGVFAAFTEASQDIGDVPLQDVQRAVREYRNSKKERPGITVVAEVAQVQGSSRQFNVSRDLKSRRNPALTPTLTNCRVDTIELESLWATASSLLR